MSLIYKIESQLNNQNPIRDYKYYSYVLIITMLLAQVANLQRFRRLNDITTKEVQEKVDSLLKLENQNKIDLQGAEIKNKQKMIQVTRVHLEVKSYINAMACSSDGRYIACGCHDGVIRVFDPQQNRLVVELKGHSGSVTSLKYSFDHKYLASASVDNTVMIWDMNQIKQVGKPMKGHTKAIGTLCFSPDGSYLASGSSDNTIRIWRVQDNQLIKCLNSHSESLTFVVYSPDAKLLASASNKDGMIRLWNTETGFELKFQLKADAYCIKGLKFSKSGKQLISVGNDTIQFWEVQTGKEVKRLGGSYREEMLHLYNEIKVNGFLIYGNDDEFIRVWNVSASQGLNQFAMDSSVCQFWMSPDDQYVTSVDFVKWEEFKIGI